MLYYQPNNKTIWFFHAAFNLEKVSLRGCLVLPYSLLLNCSVRCYLTCVCSYETSRIFCFFLGFSGLICKVSAGNENACLTTNHLAALGKLEPTVVTLVIVFRYWAKVRVICILPSVNKYWMNIDIMLIRLSVWFRKQLLKLSFKKEFEKGF